LDQFHISPGGWTALGQQEQSGKTTYIGDDAWGPNAHATSGKETALKTVSRTLTWNFPAQ